MGTLQSFFRATADLAAGQFPSDGMGRSFSFRESGQLLNLRYEAGRRRIAFRAPVSITVPSNHSNHSINPLADEITPERFPAMINRIRAEVLAVQPYGDQP